MGWVYLTVFLDLYSRKIVGYSTSENLQTSCVLRAFKNAVSDRMPWEGLIIHSDRGIQYASHEFRHQLELIKAQQNM
ncbi:MAG: putative transposase [Lysobacterales bacterium]|jgi:putative transposase